MQRTSKHLDNDGKATRASGEGKKSHLMDGIVGGLPKRVSPVIVDGIVRGVSKNLNPGLAAEVSKVEASATPKGRGMFGSGAFPEGKM
jgi:hypothetical protein